MSLALDNAGQHLARAAVQENFRQRTEYFRPRLRKDMESVGVDFNTFVNLLSENYISCSFPAIEAFADQQGVEINVYSNISEHRGNYKPATRIPTKILHIIYTEDGRFHSVCSKMTIRNVSRDSGIKSNAATEAMIASLAKEREEINTRIQEMELKVKPMAGDGNCLFRAIHHQLGEKLGVDITFQRVRRLIVEEIKRHPNIYASLDLQNEYVGEGIDTLEKLCEELENLQRSPPLTGGNGVLIAAATLFSITIKVISSTGADYDTEHTSLDESRPSIEDEDHVFVLAHYPLGGDVNGHYDSTEPLIVTISPREDINSEEDFVGDLSPQRLQELDAFVAQLQNLTGEMLSQIMSAAKLEASERPKALMNPFNAPYFDFLDSLLPAETRYVEAEVSDAETRNIVRQRAEQVRAEIVMGAGVDIAPQDILVYPHLDGVSTFGDFVDNEVPGVSIFAIKQPVYFQRVVQRLRQEYPNAFKITPPSSAVDSGKRKGLIYGRCQVGKTGTTLALAWLYYHYCGCYAFLGCWRFKTSVEKFKGDIDAFNEKLRGWFPDLVKILLQKSTAMFYAELYYCTPGRNEGFDSRTHAWRCAQVLVLLANPAQLERLKRQLQWLVNFNSQQFFKLGKRVPLVLLMDEDDDNIQTYRRDKYKKERHINDEIEDEYQVEETDASLNSLVDVVYHYVGISATHHANLVAEASTNVDRELQLIKMDIPHDYCGFCLPEDSLGHEIQCMEIDQGEMSVMVDEMIGDGCRRFLDIDPHLHQMAGRAVVQLAIPQQQSIDGIEYLADHMADSAKKILDQLRLENLPVIVSTLHGSNSGNRIFLHNWYPDLIKDSLLEDLNDNGKTDVVSATEVAAPGQLLSSQIMNMFRKQLEIATDMGFPGIYCAIVAHNKAGRAVTMK